jgi:hypothetical protein
VVEELRRIWKFVVVVGEVRKVQLRPTVGFLGGDSRRCGRVKDVHASSTRGENVFDIVEELPAFVGEWLEDCMLFTELLPLLVVVVADAEPYLLVVGPPGHSRIPLLYDQYERVMNLLHLKAGEHDKMASVQ